MMIPYIYFSIILYRTIYIGIIVKEYTIQPHFFFEALSVSSRRKKENILMQEIIRKNKNNIRQLGQTTNISDKRSGRYDGHCQSSLQQMGSLSMTSPHDRWSFSQCDIAFSTGSCLPHHYIFIIIIIIFITTWLASASASQLFFITTVSAHCQACSIIIL